MLSPLLAYITYVWCNEMSRNNEIMNQNEHSTHHMVIECSQTMKIKITNKHLMRKHLNHGNHHITERFEPEQKKTSMKI